MANNYDDEIDLVKLVLDAENPRHPRLSSQRDILAWMTSGTGRIGHKIHNLARDISLHGMNPAERLMVAPIAGRTDEFLVLEGNRRAAAAKMLQSPDAAPTEEWKRRFRQLRKSQRHTIRKVACTVFESPEAAYHFIELKHLGESDGAGVVPWNAQQKTRHDERTKGRSRHHRALDVLDFLRGKNPLDADLEKTEDSFPLTTLDRILSDPEFRAFLGLTTTPSGDIAFAIEPEEALKPLMRIVHDLATKKKKVGDVINKTKREEYRNELQTNERPDHTKILEEAVPLRDSGQVSSISQKSMQVRAKGTPDPRSRRTVALRGASLPIDARGHGRARRVFDELRRIELRDNAGGAKYPNAAILLMRLFLELSVDSYIEKKKLTHPAPSGWKEVSLIEKGKAVLKDLRDHGKLDHKEARAISKIFGDKNRLANPNSLNDMAHSIHQIPNPSDIIDVWDSYTPYLLAIWDALR